MLLRENVPLATLTTFKVGGNARYVAECSSEEDILTALAFSRERGLPWYVIGGGSNILASDEGYAGLIIQPMLKEVSWISTGEVLTVTAGAGVAWDDLVEESVIRKLWGFENLAGIPGLVGGAPVQNIGAYGADVETLLYVDALDTKTDMVVRFTKDECLLGYRDSRFKHEASLIILRAAFRLSSHDSPRITYADIAARIQAGAILDTSASIASVIRDIRSKKFPDLTVSGTAGSFFKNPIISLEKYAALRSQYPELPGFSVSIEPELGTMTEMKKIPLAWILDHVFHLRNFSLGNVRLFEQQPLVIVSEKGATRKEIEKIAEYVENLVKNAVGISIEREVRMLS